MKMVRKKMVRNEMRRKEIVGKKSVDRYDYIPVSLESASVVSSRPTRDYLQFSGWHEHKECLPSIVSA